MFKLDLEKAEEPEVKLQHPLDHRRSRRVPEKHLLLFYWLHQSLWLCRSKQTGKFVKRWEHQTTLPASWEICMQVKKHWNMYNIIYETNHQSRFNAWYWMLGSGALRQPRGMVRGGRREGGSGWGTCVVDSCWCMAKPIQYCKVINLQLK